MPYLNLVVLASEACQLVDALLPDQGRVHVKDHEALDPPGQRLVLHVQVHAMDLGEQSQVSPQHRKVKSRRDRNLRKEKIHPPKRVISAGDAL